MQLRRFFSWPDALKKFDPQWTAAYEVGKALAVSMGDWCHERKPPLEHGEEEKTLEEKARTLLQGSQKGQGCPGQPARRLSGAESLAVMRKGVRNGMHLCTQILGDRRLQKEGRMILEAVWPIREHMAKALKMQTNQKDAMLWRAKEIVQDINVVGEIVRTTALLPKLKRFGISVDGPFQRLPDEPLTPWDHEKPLAQQYITLVVELCSERVWEGTYNSIQLPHRWAIIFHDDKDERNKGMKALHEMHDALQRAESMCPPDDNSDSSIRGLGRLLSDLTFRRNQIVQELWTMAAESDWKPAAKAVRGVTWLMFARPFSTKIYNEDVFRDVRHCQRAASFKSGRWARFSQAIQACESRRENNFPFVQTHSSDWAMPLTAPLSIADVFIPPSIYIKSPLSNILIERPSEHIGVDEKCAVNLAPLLNPRGRGRRTKGTEKVVVMSGLAKQCKSASASLLLVELFKHEVSDRAHQISKIDLHWRVSLLGKGYVYAIWRAADQQDPDDYVLSFGSYTYSAYAWRLKQYKANDGSKFLSLYDPNPPKEQLMVLFGHETCHGSVRGVTTAVCIPAELPPECRMHGLVLRIKEEEKCLIRFALRSRMQMTVPTIKHMMAEFGVGIPKGDKESTKALLLERLTSTVFAADSENERLAMCQGIIEKHSEDGLDVNNEPDKTLDLVGQELPEDFSEVYTHDSNMSAYQNPQVSFTLLPHTQTFPFCYSVFTFRYLHPAILHF